MALPAVLLKAKNAIKKGATAYNAEQQAKSLTDGEELKSSLFNKFKLPIMIGGFLFVVAVFFLMVIVAVPFILADSAFGSEGSSGDASPTQIGEAASIEGEEARIEWLYDGNGIPQTEEENAKYLETFDVEYLDDSGNRQTFQLTMHKKLKAEVQAIFSDMVKANFKIEWKSGGGSIRGWNSDLGYKGTFYRSAHCYGHAVDINVDANPCIGTCGHVGGTYAPGVDPYSVTPEIVNIWKSHGFYWGGDWTQLQDYMHFSYFNH